MYAMQHRITFDEFLSGKLRGYSLEEKGVLLLAWQIAVREHEGQTRRSGGQFIEHPMAVAKMAKEIDLPVIDQAANLLHDTIEEGEITAEEIETVFGPGYGLPISFKVVAMTRKVGQTVEEYMLQIYEAVKEDWGIIFDKALDRLHNLVCPYGGDQERELTMLQETVGPFRQLCRKCRRFIPIERLASYDEIVSQIMTLAEHRLVEIQSQQLGPV